MHPTGIVTFLFTDIEGSTKLWQEHPRSMPESLARHHLILRQAVESRRGHVFQIVGDAFCAAFHTAADGVAAAVDAQRALQRESWGETGPLPVRMGLHTGAAECRLEDITSGQYVSSLTLTRAQRIMSVAHGGQVLLSHVTEALVHDELPESTSLRDLGEHRLKDLWRPERIFELIAPGLRGEFPPLKTVGARPNNLPVPLTSFVGREREMEQIERRLAGVRLLTLTGSGGAGKSRLALEVAGTALDGFPDGGWLVELAPLSDPALVPQAITSVMGLSAEHGRPVTNMLFDHLRSKSLLLILDNCEHLVAACAQLASDLLHACPNLKILATSREPLDIAGETAFRVPSLGLPEPERPSLETLARCEAVRLLVERAVSVKPDFRVTSANADAVARVCRRLDGIPLAIELAAARLKVFTVEQIAARLDDRFRLLTSGSRTSVPRQQTLHALIDWSHGLLSPSERVLFRRLAVFAGGCTFEAAEGVCAGDGVERGDVLDVLAQLVNKSLVLAEEQDGESRYRMLETIRHYARERLQEAGEVETLSDRHLRYFLGLAKEAEPQLLRADQVRWLERLGRELDNIRAGLAWSLASDRIDAGMALASELWRFWQMQGLIGEGRECLRRLLTKGDRASDGARAQALYQAAFEASMDHDRSGANSLANESLALCRRLGDRWGTALCLVILGATTASDDYEQAEALLNGSIGLFREIGDRWRLGQALMYLAAAREERRDFHGATAPREENLALFRALGDRRGIGFSLLALARAARSTGDNERAGQLSMESLAHFEAAADKQGLATTLLFLGTLKADQREFGQAREFLARGITLFHDAGSAIRVAQSLAVFGNVAMAQGQWGRAATLYGATEALLESSQARLPPAQVIEYERMVTSLRSRLDPAAFEAAWKSGRAMTVEQAIRLALSDEAGGGG